MIKTIKLYKSMLQFFFAKKDKVNTVYKYLAKSLVRGGTFWIKHVWGISLLFSLYMLYVRLSYTASTEVFRAIYTVLSQLVFTLLTHFILFVFIAAIFNFFRELYFDYVSNNRR